MVFGSDFFVFVGGVGGARVEIVWFYSLKETTLRCLFFIVKTLSLPQNIK